MRLHGLLIFPVLAAACSSDGLGPNSPFDGGNDLASGADLVNLDRPCVAMMTSDFGWAARTIHCTTYGFQERPPYSTDVVSLTGPGPLGVSFAFSHGTTPPTGKVIGFDTLALGTVASFYDASTPSRGWSIFPPDPRNTVMLTQAVLGVPPDIGVAHGTIDVVMEPTPSGSTTTHIFAHVEF